MVIMILFVMIWLCSLTQSCSSKFGPPTTLHTTTQISPSFLTLNSSCNQQWDVISSINYKIYSNTSFNFRFNCMLPINMRFDTYSSILIDINLNLCDQDSMTVVMAQLVIELENKIIYFTFGRLNKQIGFSGVAFGSVNQLFSFLSLSNQIYIHTQTAATNSQNCRYNQRLNLPEILKNLCQFQNAPLECNGKIRNIYYQFNLSRLPDSSFSSGEFYFDTLVNISRNCTTQNDTIYAQKYNIIHSITGNLLTDQYANISRPFYENREPDIQEFIFDYKFFVQSTNPKAATMIINPFSNQNNSENYPKKHQIFSNFSLIVTGKENTSLLAEILQLFSLENQQTKLQALILISKWTNSSKQAISQIKSERLNGSHIFFLTDQEAFNVNQKVIFDVNISKLINQIPQLSNMSITSVKRVFQVYYGEIAFQVINQNVEIINMGQPPYSLSKQVRNSVSSLLSIPNIGIILRLAGLLNLLDDLSYFIYHNTTYDAAFTFFCNLSWQWTNSKWLPPLPLQSFMGLNLSSGAEPRWVSSRGEAIHRFRAKNEHMPFLDNCKGFLIYTVPSSLLMFLLLWKLYWIINHYKISAIIRAFSSWFYLLISLVGDNSQYLSFRAFEQLRSFQPTNYLIIFSQFLAVTSLFIAVICSCSLLPVAHSIACRLFRPPSLLRAIESYKFFVIWAGLRFIAGYIHATIDNSLLRISFLLALQMTMAISTILSWPCTRYKTPHTTLIIGQIARLLLYLLICLEVIFPSLAGSFDFSDYVSDISLLLVLIMFIASVLQILLTILIGAFVKSKDFQIRTKLTTNNKNREQKPKQIQKIKVETIQKVKKPPKTLQSTKRRMIVKVQPHHRKIRKEQMLNKNLNPDIQSKILNNKKPGHVKKNQKSRFIQQSRKRQQGFLGNKIKKQDLFKIDIITVPSHQTKRQSNRSS